MQLIDQRRGLLVLVALLAACSSETAVLVAVTGSGVDELEFHVGVLDTEGDHVLVPEISGDRVTVRGRNLSAAPYELLLRKEDAVPAGALNVRVLALAYRQENGEQTLVGFALTEPPQRFIDGEIVRRAIRISGLNNRSIHKNRDCVRVQIEDQRYDLVAADDRDCDGSLTADDCKDSDPAIYPGAIERCDGKDNDCDGAYAPRDQRCYARVGEGDASRCHEGSRVCLDAEGKGFEADCKTAGDPVPAIFCEAYDRCGAACSDLIQRRALSCTVEIASLPDQGKKAICDGARWTLSGPGGAEGCGWQVVSSQGIEVKLEGPDGPVEKLESCEPSAKMLALGAPPTEAARATVVYRGRPEAVFEASFTAKVVEACSGQPLICN